MKHLLAVGASLLALALGAAGCGKGPDHNYEDVRFTQNMVPHHQQAVTMSDLAMTQTANTKIHEIADRIKTSQLDEITFMNGWLETWKVKPAGHDMGNMSESEGMEGMLSDADMRTLEAANTAEFDRLFLQRMTTHHKGAISMAKVELDEGKYGPAKELARRITTTQEKEIAEMEQLLGAAPAP